MKLYLSSYGIGDKAGTLKAWVPGGQIGYVPNALDFPGADPDRRSKHIERDCESLQQLGLTASLIDLRGYFGHGQALRNRLSDFKAVFVTGGNVFVLRQAMKLSGLDAILWDWRERADFLYAGYSAGGCVLAPHLKVYESVDARSTPYQDLQEVVCDGLGIVDFAMMPHWNSDHPESAAIGQAIAYCQQHHIAYRAISDGEVITVE
ncbi:MAG: Type 1 glutamine amidotransferase-like domain-containing protein [Steroidobacteraceae bacterium]